MIFLKCTTGYNYKKNEKGEEIRDGKKELLYIHIYSGFGNIRHYNSINDETYGDYVVLKIDENTSINIQLFYKEFLNRGACIEKFICNGVEYINLEYVGEEGNKALIQKTNDIIIE